jgi:hypothetical protein
MLEAMFLIDLSLQVINSQLDAVLLFLTSQAQSCAGHQGKFHGVAASQSSLCGIHSIQ